MPDQPDGIWNAPYSGMQWKKVMEKISGAGHFIRIGAEVVPILRWFPLTPGLGMSAFLDESGRIRRCKR